MIYMPLTFDYQNKTLDIKLHFIIKIYMETCPFAMLVYILKKKKSCKIQVPCWWTLNVPRAITQNDEALNARNSQSPLTDTPTGYRQTHDKNGCGPWGCWFPAPTDWKLSWSCSKPSPSVEEWGSHRPWRRSRFPLPLTPTR